MPALKYFLGIVSTRIRFGKIYVAVLIHSKPNFPFYTPENLRFSGVFSGYRKEKLV